MATTRLSDVIIPAVFAPYAVQKSLESNALYQSGIIAPDAQFNAFLQGGGKTFDLPFWADLSGDANVGSDDPAVLATPLKIGAGQDVAIRLNRNSLWSSMDLAGALAGSDPAGVIAGLVAGFWDREFKKYLLAILKGVIADNVANDGGDMVYSIATDAAGAPGAGEKISGTAVIAAKQTMGDQSGNLTAIAMHSVVYSELQRQNLIAFIPNSQADIGFGTYLGYSVIVDDGCPADAGTNRITYTTYLFGRGALAYGEGTPKVPVAIHRIEEAGNGSGEERLIHRREFILHPRGVKFTSTSLAGASPTNTELATATNWDRVYPRKAVRIAALKTNG